jgi:phytoene dehydrogenase-like protein
MIEKTYDAVIIGGGSAGMAAAAVIAQRGFSCAIVERESGLGEFLPNASITDSGFIIQRGAFRAGIRRKVRAYHRGSFSRCLP